MIKECSVCERLYSFNEDINGAAIMMAFAHGHSSTWSNICICPECYEEFVKEPLKALNNAANLRLTDLE